MIAHRQRRQRGPKQRTALWVAPVFGALLAMVLAGAALTLDQHVDWRAVPVPVFIDSASTARVLLSVIGGAVATLLSLVFTVIALVIQLASAQYTPRALSILLGDRPSHVTIGVLVGTVTYTLILLLCLRLTRLPEGDLVAGLSITLAFVLAVLSLGIFVVYSNHIIHQSRVTSIIGRISTETRLSIDRLYPPFSDEPIEERRPIPPSGEPDQVILADKPGVLVDIDGERLLELAYKNQGVFAFRSAIGTFVPEGAVLMDVYGCSVEETKIRPKVRLAIERSFRLDAAFGLRQLVDIAARALSTGVNDPATAVQVIDQLHDLLRRLGQRRLSDASEYDDNGQCRVILSMLTWEEVLHLTFDELRQYSVGSLTVTRRLHAVLLDLHTVVPPFRQASIERQLELLETAVNAAFKNPKERALAQQADSRGTGF